MEQLNEKFAKDLLKGLSTEVDRKVVTYVDDEGGKISSVTTENQSVWQRLQSAKYHLENAITEANLHCKDSAGKSLIEQLLADQQGASRAEIFVSDLGIPSVTYTFSDKKAPPTETPKTPKAAKPSKSKMAPEKSATTSTTSADMSAGLTKLNQMVKKYDSDYRRIPLPDLRTLAADLGVDISSLGRRKKDIADHLRTACSASVVAVETETVEVAQTEATVTVNSEELEAEITEVAQTETPELEVETVEVAQSEIENLEAEIEADIRAPKRGFVKTSPAVTPSKVVQPTTLSGHLNLSHEKSPTNENNPLGSKSLSDLKKKAVKVDVGAVIGSLDQLLDDAMKEDGLVSPEDDGEDGSGMGVMF